MNRNIAIVLLALAGASSAFADDITVDATPFVSSASRAQVQAELQQSRQSSVNPWAQDYNPQAAFRSDKSRAEVTAEYIRSRGEAAALVAEDGGSVLQAQRTRAAGNVFAFNAQ